MDVAISTFIIVQNIIWQFLSHQDRKFSSLFVNVIGVLSTPNAIDMTIIQKNSRCQQEIEK